MNRSKVQTRTQESILSLAEVEIRAEKYLALCDAIREYTTELEDHKRVIKDYLETATPQGAVKMCGRTFFLYESSREIFDLKRARQVFKDQQLKPFIRLSTSKVLRTK